MAVTSVGEPESASIVVPLEVELSIRPMTFDDLGGLDWSGSSAHLQALAEALGRAEGGELELLIVTVRGDRSVGCGAVRFTGADDESGELTMLSVHPDWQSLGVGTALIEALEGRISARGRIGARISVEHDNPRAAALYRRLGYRADGERVESWSVGGGRSYVTTCITAGQTALHRTPLHDTALYSGVMSTVLAWILIAGVAALGLAALGGLVGLLRRPGRPDDVKA